MTAVSTVCAECGTPSTEAVSGRCPSCAAAADERRRARERERSDTRSADQPWRRLYGLAIWKRCRGEVLERDGHRCQLKLSRRCTKDRKLHACHWPESVEELWGVARGDWELFVELASDEAFVVTGCEPCHVVLDSSRRVG